MPIISSTASDQLGQCYNINADTAAAQVAIALKAGALFICLMSRDFTDPSDTESLLSSLAVDQVKPLQDEGVIANVCFQKSIVR